MLLRWVDCLMEPHLMPQLEYWPGTSRILILLISSNLSVVIFSLSQFFSIIPILDFHTGSMSFYLSIFLFVDPLLTVTKGNESIHFLIDASHHNSLSEWHLYAVVLRLLKEGVPYVVPYDGKKLCNPLWVTSMYDIAGYQQRTVKEVYLLLSTCKSHCVPVLALTTAWLIHCKRECKTQTHLKYKPVSVHCLILVSH